jgi:DNA polymerase I
MNIPLIAISGRNSFNRQTRKQNVIIWGRGRDKLIVPSPREHYYYVRGDGSQHPDELYNVLGRNKKIPFKRHLVENASELNPDLIGPTAKIDGVINNELERICIEQPDFFTSFAGAEPSSLGFDLEVHSADGSFPKGEKHPIVAIGVVTGAGDRKVFTWDGECDKGAILNFLNFIKEYDPDILYGYNVIGYDFPQLFARAKVNGIQLKPYLNRENNATFGWESDFSYHKRAKLQAWGRIIVDVYNFVGRDYALSGQSKSLKNVSRFYGLNPIELNFAAKDILQYSEEEIEEYVLSDCDCTKFLFNHYFPQHKFIAEFLRVPLEMYINGPDNFITKILQGRALYKQKILTLDKNIDRHPDIKSFQAAYIKLYRPGFHPRNIKIDFKSMYPSIAMALNLGPDTTRIIGYENYNINEFGCTTTTPNLMILTIPDNVLNKNVIIEVDQSHKSCLYQMSKEFKDLREPFKHQDSHEAKSKSNALKIMVNTFYGANTNLYMTYGDISVGVAITGIARWLIMGAKSLIQKRYGDNTVVYIHTDGVNLSMDVDIEWVNNELQKAMGIVFPLSESEWIEVEKEEFKEGYWLQIGNYVLRNLDGTLTRHGSTFKSKSRSMFYKKIIDEIIEAAMSKTVDKQFMDNIYNLDRYELSDFKQQRTMNQKLSEYKSANDLVVQLARDAAKIGMEVGPGTTFMYYKTMDGYHLEQFVKSKDDIDIKYHWNIITSLMKKFSLERWVKKKVPITVLDKNQQSLMEFV